VTRRFTIDVTQTVEVELDETKFTDEFMEEFREGFFDFWTLADHAAHIAQLQARGLIDCERVGDFIEGYGPSADMGITARVVAQCTDTEQVSA